MYVCMYACMHACMYACMYVCVRLHTPAVQWKDTGKRITNCKNNWQTPDIIFRLGWWFWFVSPYFLHMFPTTPTPIFSPYVLFFPNCLQMCSPFVSSLSPNNFPPRVVSPLSFPDQKPVLYWWWCCCCCCCCCCCSMSKWIWRSCGASLKLDQEGRPEEFPFLHVLTTVTRSLYK